MKTKSDEENKQKVSINKIFDFSQLKKFDDIKNVGNCYAYSVLVLSYVTLFNLFAPNNEINYSKLPQVLNQFDSIKKRELNSLQNFYRQEGKVNYKQLLDFEVAPFTENSSSKRANHLFDFSNELLHTTQNFKNSSFYFLLFFDMEQKILGNPLAHAVVFHVTKENEIYFFDANSGIYRINIADTCSIDHLHNALKEIIFTNNFLFRYFLNADSKTTYYRYDKCIPKEELHAYGKGVKQFLQDYIDNPKLFSEPIDYKIFNNSERVKSFLDRNLFILKQTLPYFLESKQPQIITRKDKKKRDEESSVDKESNSYPSAPFFNQTPISKEELINTANDKISGSQLNVSKK